MKYGKLRTRMAEDKWGKSRRASSKSQFWLLSEKEGLFLFRRVYDRTSGGFPAATLLMAGKELEEGRRNYVYYYYPFYIY